MGLGALIPSGLSNLFDQNRLRSLYQPETINAPLQSRSPFAPPPPPEPQNPIDIYNDVVTHPPEYRNPSPIRAIGTGLLSAIQGEHIGDKAFNFDEAGKILHAPLNRDIAEWGAKTDALQKAATIQSGRERQVSLDAQRYAGITNNQGKLDLATWKAKHPNGKLYAPKGGNVIMVDPITHEATDTGIATGSLTEKERLDIQGQQGLERIAATGYNQQQNIAAQGTERMKQIGAQGEENRATKATVGGGTDKPEGTESARETKIRHQNNADEAGDEHPEWREFIHLNPKTGYIDIDPPTTNIYGRTSGPTQAEYDDMYKRIYGRDRNAPPPTTPPTKSTTKPSTTKPSTASKPTAGATASQPQVVTKTQTNSKTGDKRTLYSRDNGKTWTLK